MRLRPTSVMLAAAACLLALPARADEVPPPSQTPCEVIVNGPTSTLKSIVVKKVGQNIPRIYHAKQTCKNTPGFDWYVSQHYALKGNVGDKLAEHFLTLAELAYPHYVEVLGREPPDIETTRMVLVHATDLDSLQTAVKSDLDMPWVGNGGGVTLPASGAAYNFPSGTLQYHRNDLSLHEGLHLAELSSVGEFGTPLVFLEGITHALANHVYDPAKRQLTVAVFDKAPINNPIDAGLRLMREKGTPDLSDILLEKTPKEFYPGAITLLTQFFWTDPDRLMKWRLWRDELFRGAAPEATRAKSAADALAKVCGGSLDEMNELWHAWVRRRANTFTHVDWGWEQWGETLQSYGWPWSKRYYAQMNINCPLGRALAEDPLRLDYPRGPKSPLVGMVRLGGDEPSVGCVIDFRRADNQGWAGLGLGVNGRNLLRIVVDRNERIIMDGTLLDLKTGLKQVDFAPEFESAAKAGGAMGMTVRIARASVEVALRMAGTGGGAPREMTASYAITREERQDLLMRPMALVSLNARHEITPYFADLPASPPDLTKPAPPNRWRYAGDKQAYKLYQVAWRMGDKAPASVGALKTVMIAAMDKEPPIQDKAMEAYRRQVGEVAKDLQKLGTPEARDALVLLSGASITLSVEPTATPEKVGLVAKVTGALEGKVSGAVKLAMEPQAATAAARPLQVDVEAGKSTEVRWTVSLPAEGKPARATVSVELTWQGMPLSISASRALRP